MHTVQKKQEVNSDGHAGQRGSHGGMEGRQGVCGTVYTFISKAEAKK